MEVRSCESPRVTVARSHELAEVRSCESPRGDLGPSPIFLLVPPQGRGDVSPEPGVLFNEGGGRK